MNIPISVVIMTKNESTDIADCIKSVAWSDDIHVLDSYSTDNTTSIASDLNASIQFRVFDNYAAQRNHSMHNIQYKHDWLLILDADERIPIVLAQEMAHFIQHADISISAARMCRRDYWWNTWLKHAQISPFFIRLVRPNRVHYEREINEVILVDGPIHELKSHFDHYPFSKGLNHWVAKHNHYSDMEANLISNKTVINPSLKIAFLGNDFNERRTHQKAIFYKLPARPFIKFFYMIFIRQSFLDGWAGIRYTFLQCIYEYLIVLKSKELKDNKLQRTTHK